MRMCWWCDRFFYFPSSIEVHRCSNHSESSMPRFPCKKINYISCGVWRIPGVFTLHHGWKYMQMVAANVQPQGNTLEEVGDDVTSYSWIGILCSTSDNDSNDSSNTKKRILSGLGNLFMRWRVLVVKSAMNANFYTNRLIVFPSRKLLLR